MTEDQTKSIERLPNEHFLIYLNRLLSLKENKKIDIEKSEIYELVFGKELSSCESRKRLYNWRDIVEKAEEEGQNIQSVIKDLNEVVNTNNQLISPDKIKHLTDEEDRTQVIDMGNKFHIYNSKRSIVIDKEKVKKIKEMYCDEHPLTINELCRKLDIPRRDFMLLKIGLSICHSDVPYLDEDIQDEKIQDLVDTTLERRKEKYFIKLQQEEIRQMKKELNTYRNKDYFFTNIIKKLNNITITPTKYNVEIKKSEKHREALADLMDLHLGIKIDNYWNKYSVAIAKKRAKVFTEEVIKRCAEAGANILHLSSLGDLLSGTIHESLRLQQEINVEKQIEVVAEILEKMITEFANSGVFDKVIIASVVGNHGRMVAQKESSLDNENFEYLVHWGIKKGLKDLNNIVFEDNFYDDGIIVKEICGVVIFECHGHEGQVGRIAEDLSMMIKKPSEIHLGHRHKNESFEKDCVEVITGRSFSGVDSYAKGKYLFSKAGQKLFIYEDGQRLSMQDIVLN